MFFNEYVVELRGGTARRVEVSINTLCRSVLAAIILT